MSKILTEAAICLLPKLRIDPVRKSIVLELFEDGAKYFMIKGAFIPSWFAAKNGVVFHHAMSFFAVVMLLNEYRRMILTQTV